MKKRILSIVLTICMLISAFPMMGIGVSAAGSPVCEVVGGDAYPTIADAVAEASSSDTIKLLRNVEENVTIASGKTVTLDLNGYVLKGIGDASVIYNEGNLTVCDSNTGKQTHYFTVNADCLWVWDDSKTTNAKTVDELTDFPAEGDVMAVFGGCITGGTGTCVPTGTKVITYAYHGGAIFAQNDSETHITGGNICGNTAANNGGGLELWGVYDTENCLVAGNVAGVNGGGIHDNVKAVSYEGALYANIKAGTRMYCNKAKAGGGLYSDTRGATQTISSCEICYNKVTYVGGGLGLGASTAVITLNDTKINNNYNDCTAVTSVPCGGGGVFLYRNIVTMNGGEICNNISAGQYGGVKFKPDAKSSFKISGNVKINGNKAGTEQAVNNFGFDNNTMPITIDSAKGLSEDAIIGVNFATVSTSFGFVTGASKADAVHFFSDNSSYKVKFNTDHLELVERSAGSVCEIVGGDDYTTIAAALTAASNSDTIRLLENVEENVTIASGKTVTLDLNGYVLKGAGNDSVINSEGNLTVCDSNTGNQTHYFTVNADGSWTWNDDNKSGAKTVDELTDFPAEGDVMAVNAGCITGGSGHLFNKNYHHGGGIFSYYTGKLTVKDVAICGNKTLQDSYGNYNQGGGIVAFGALEINNSLIVGNCAGGGGGVASMKNGKDAVGGHTVSITATKLYCNTSYSESNHGGGGIIFNAAGFTTSLDSCDICFNTSANFGGGFYVFSNNLNITLNKVKVNNNRSNAMGGGGYISQDNVTITDCEICDNTAATKGGGLAIKNYNKNTVYDTTLSGVVKITGNKSGTGAEEKISNMEYVTDTCYRVKLNGLSAGSSIGVTPCTAPTAETPVSITADGAASDAEYFFSDSESYKVKFNTDHFVLIAPYAITNGTPQDDKATNNGYITVSEGAFENDTVTVTATPDAGYVLDTISANKTGDTSTPVAVSADGTFTMPAYDVTVSATFKSADNTPAEFKNANYQYAVTLGTKLSMQVMITGITGSIDMNKFNVTIGKTEVTGLTYKDGVITGTVKEISPEQMTDEFTVTYSYNGVAFKTTSDISFAEYFEAVMDYYENEVIDELCRTALNYGAAAQVMVSYKTDKLANSGLDAEQKDVAATGLASYTPVANNASNVVSASVSLDAGISIVINCHIETDGANVEAVNNKGKYVQEKYITTSDTTVTIAERTADKLGYTYSITIDGEETTYSAYDYLYFAQNPNGVNYSEANAALCRALYEYAEAAAAYVGN